MGGQTLTFPREHALRIAMASMNFGKAAFYWAPSLAGVCIWAFALAQFSEWLAPWGITFFTAGLFVVVPALLMPFYRGLANVVLCGFVLDASFPVPFELTHSLSFWASSRGVSLFGELLGGSPAFFGFITGWMIFAFLILRLLRSRITTVNPRGWLVVAEIANAAIFVFWAIALGWTRLGDGAYWLGMLLNLLFSGALIFLFGGWFFDLLFSAYRICGIDLLEEREAECDS